jgi:hypothetical protein
LNHLFGRSFIENSGLEIQTDKMSFFTKKKSTAESSSSSAEDIEQQQVSEPSKSDDEPYVTEAATTLDRAAFLDTFTPEEQKKIIRKVDYRILLIVGLIYLVKQVYTIFFCLQVEFHMLIKGWADRCQQCI